MIQESPLRCERSTLILIYGSSSVFGKIAHIRVIRRHIFPLRLHQSLQQCGLTYLPQAGYQKHRGHIRQAQHACSDARVMYILRPPADKLKCNFIKDDFFRKSTGCILKSHCHFCGKLHKMERISYHIAGISRLTAARFDPASQGAHRFCPVRSGALFLAALDEGKRAPHRFSTDCGCPLFYKQCYWPSICGCTANRVALLTPFCSVNRV